jgi:hypothetical protein
MRWLRSRCVRCSQATPISDIKQVKSLLRNEQMIQIIVCRKAALHFVFTQCYISALINIISWNAAYSIFPRTTFLKHEKFPLAPLDAYFGRLHAKYSQRGWRMKLPTSQGTNVSRGGLFQLVRLMQYQLDDLAAAYQTAESRIYDLRVGGMTTWRMTLNTDLVERPLQPDSVIEYARI